MSVENEYIQHTEENQEKEPKSTKKSRRKSTAKKKTTKKKNTAVRDFLDKFQTKKVKNTTGVVLILFSVFIFISCGSYLFNWQADQSRVLNKSFFEFIFSDNEEPVANWLGKFGAWISHLLIYRWFGVASFGFSLILLVLGVKSLFNFKILPPVRTTAITLVTIVWTSLLLGYFSSSISYLGGTFGFELNDWFKLTFGSFGALLFILAIGYIFTIILFNEAFAKIYNFIRFRGKDVLKEDKTNKVQEEIETEEESDFVNAVISENKQEEFVESTEDDIQTVEFDNTVEEPQEEIMDEESTEIVESEVIDLDNTSSNDAEITVDDDQDGFEVTVAELSEDDAELSEDEVEDKRTEYGEYDPKLDLSNYALPSIDLLNDYGGKKEVSVNKEELEANKNKIVETLSHYKIEIAKIMATVGPTVTLYEIIPAPGVRISKIKNLEDDIALSLAALGIRIIAPIPGKGTIGIEVPNSTAEMVSMRSLIASKKFQESKFELPVVMGKTITNETYTFDLTKMPHLLVAGATGQGKSVGLNAILVSILYKKHPSQVKFVLVDPKKVELTLYNKIERHFLAKLPDEEDAIITDTSKVVNTMNSLCIEMDDRYELLKTAQVRTIKEYNAKFIARKLNPEKGHRYLPYIVVLIDEFADLIMTAGKEIETPIARLAQLARAIGIHLIVATQRPSVNVITGMIKANFPARIAFRVLSKIDSRTILDASGADQLIGRGDMLISTGQDIVRLQCGFVDTPEVEDICDFIGDQRGYPDALHLPEYVGEAAEGGGSMDDEELDALFADAARIVVMHQQGSASLLQRKLKLGYNRAGRIVDQLEGMGIIGPFKGSKARDVLFADEQMLEEFLASKGLV